jgi:hypothetical protein
MRRMFTVPTIHVDSTEEKVKDFANKLATDDAFRATMLKDPEGTLAPFGIRIPPGQIKRPVQLPSKKDLQATINRQSEPDVSPYWAWLAFLAFL